MNINEAILNRRSIRKYTTEPVDKDSIHQLIKAATYAPSAMNSQPWAFSVIQDVNLLKDFSDRAKQHLLTTLDERPYLAGYKRSFENPNFNIFYNASTLLTIYAKSEGPNSLGDCSLAAQNIMLTAHSLGLGSCWIGFARMFLNLPEIKEELHVPEDYIIVAPLIIGYPAKPHHPAPKKEAEILYWK